MATLDEKHLAKEILFKLIDGGGLDYKDFPEVTTSLDLTLATYEKILKTISDKEE